MKNFERYRSQDGELEAMIQVNAAASRETLACKGKEYKIRRTGYEILSPVVFPDTKKHPISGGWYEFLSVNLCGDHMKTKYMIVAQNGKPPKIIAYLPGTTKADPVLQRDAVRMGVVAVGSKNVCDHIRVIDTQYIKALPDGAWEERWIFKSCDVQKLRMVFAPSKVRNGTNISVKVLD